VQIFRVANYLFAFLALSLVFFLHQWNPSTLSGAPIPTAATLRQGSLQGPSITQPRVSDEGQQPTAQPGKHATERGYAAFYSASLEGHKTACGGVYSPSQLTAAHPTLRCGTKLRVTNLRNGKSVRVTVNDRLPASGDRILDLSYAAAQALDFTRQGTTLVKIDVFR
jgi:rare lipoprotein A